MSDEKVKNYPNTNGWELGRRRDDTGEFFWNYYKTQNDVNQIVSCLRGLTAVKVAGSNDVCIIVEANDSVAGQGTAGAVADFFLTQEALADLIHALKKLLVAVQETP